MLYEETELKIVKMSEVELRKVNWLWYPYIPFGKISIIQGDPGEGKTTLALRLAAACSTGQAFPGMEIDQPFNVIYQTAEDGLGDTIKPRLMEAGANQDRMLNIVEAASLTLLDERIEAVILQTGAKLMILDPIQGYLGRKIDMNRANEIRGVLKNIAAVAERTGCAIVLVGHLNKAAGANSAYRGLGSIDFRAAARSVLLVGRMKKEPNVRVIVHDKSSLAPEGKSLAFSLGDENGFHWLDGYNDITALSWSIAQDLKNGDRRVFPDFVWGKQSAWLSARRFPQPQRVKPGGSPDPLWEAHTPGFCTKGELPRSCERGAGIRAEVYFPHPGPIVRQRRANFLTDTGSLKKHCWFCQ